MDGWPRIPQSNGRAAPTRSGTANLPPPGSVIMASVEEDLGDGMYALRWAGNRIAVSSRAALATGQSLILKSELSPEGKPTLVVQGPALPTPGSFIGPVVYRPPDRTASGQPAATNDGGQGRASETGQTGQASGNELVAGVVRASPALPPSPGSELLGLVLEPLPDFEQRMAILLLEAEEEIFNSRPEKKAEGDAARPASGDDAKPAPPDSRPAPVAPQQPASPPSAENAPAPNSQAKLPVAENNAPPPSATPAPERPAGDLPVVEGENAAEKPAAEPAARPTPVSPDGATPRPDNQANAPAADAPANARPQTKPQVDPAILKDVRIPALDDEPGFIPPAREGSTGGEAPVRETRPAVPNAPPDGAASEPQAKPETPAPPPTAQPIPSAPERPQSAAPTPSPQPPADRPPVPPSTVESVPRDPAAEVAETPKETPPQQGDAAVVKPEAQPTESVTREPSSVDAPIQKDAAPVPGESPRPAAEAGDAAPKPELIAKEALTQLVKAMAMPPASPAAEDRVVASGAKVPDAIADKAAGILLRAAGLSPDEATIEAARALIDNGVPVDRQNVLSLIALAAGAAEGDREALLRAAARLAAKDIPLAAPLVGGLADVLARTGGVTELLDKTGEALSPADAPEQTKTLLDAAKSMLDLLRVDLNQSDAGLALERFVSTFGREALGKALALVETAAQDVLQNHPLLPRLDSAISDILSILDRPADAVAPDATPRPEQPAPLPAGDGNAPPPPQSAGTAAEVPGVAARPAEPSAPPVAAPERPPAEVMEIVEGEGVEHGVLNTADPAVAADAAKPAPAPHSPVNAYLRAPRPFPGLEALNLPPMPKPVSLADAAPAPPPAPESTPTPLPGSVSESVPAPAPPADAGTPVRPEPALPANTGGTMPLPAETRPVFMPENATATDAGSAGVPPDKSAVPPSPGEGSRPAAEQGGGREAAPQDKLTPDQIVRSSVLAKLDSIFEHPGRNRPELELLRPSGFLERFLNSSAAGERDAGARLKADAEALARELLSDRPEKAAQARRELPQKPEPLLRETAARLTRMESEVLRSEPLLSRLSDAASSLRDLGRQLLAVKAENLAGQNREPGVMLAEVPFKLADDAGDGRMQMFYRRAKKGGDGWTSRVILDLNTTGMGPVLGDMRFFGQDMVLNMFVEKAETAAFLSKSADELAENLLGRGFRLKPRFMVLPPPPPAPAIQAERPEIVGEKLEEGASGSVTARRGRLDVKG